MTAGAREQWQLIVDDGGRRSSSTIGEQLIGDDGGWRIDDDDGARSITLIVDEVGLIG